MDVYRQAPLLTAAGVPRRAPWWRRLSWWLRGGARRLEAAERRRRVVSCNRRFDAYLEAGVFDGIRTHLLPIAFHAWQRGDLDAVALLRRGRPAPASLPLPTGPRKVSE